MVWLSSWRLKRNIGNTTNKRRKEVGFTADEENTKYRVVPLKILGLYWGLLSAS